MSARNSHGTSLSSLTRSQEAKGGTRRRMGIMAFRWVCLERSWGSVWTRPARFSGARALGGSSPMRLGGFWRAASSREGGCLPKQQQFGSSAEVVKSHCGSSQEPLRNLCGSRCGMTDTPPLWSAHRPAQWQRPRVWIYVAAPYRTTRLCGGLRCSYGAELEANSSFFCQWGPPQVKLFHTQKKTDLDRGCRPRLQV